MRRIMSGEGALRARPMEDQMWRVDVPILHLHTGELALHRGLPDLLGEETGCFKTPLWNGGILHVDVTLRY